MIKKYGEEIGKNKWNDYCNKQALSNSFEYKKEKFNWSKEQFDDFNKSRSVTLINLIKKHGEEKGLEIWNNYIERQRYTCTSYYFIETYGKIEGKEKYKNFCNNRIMTYSNISKELFDNISKILNNKYTLYYANTEYEFFDSKNKKSYFLDFYIEELKFGIEFNGDIFHANPEIYEKNDTPNPFNEMTSEEIWEKNLEKNLFISNQINDLMIIWESELKDKGMERIVLEVIQRIEKLKNNLE
jgi:hypothetical protein